MPSLDQLVGSQKRTSDIRSRPFRHRYLNSTVVGPSVSNGPIRFTLPKQNAGYLDISSLRFRGRLTVTGADGVTATTDAGARLAGHDASILFDRIRVMSGSNLVYDQEYNPLISNYMNGLLDPTESDYKNYERALADYPQDDARTSQVTTAHASKRIVIGKLGPAGSFLNQGALIPLEMLSSPMHIELYFTKPEVAFKSTDAGLTYKFENFELNWDALYSGSLDAHYQNNVVSHHVTQYAHRYNPIKPGTSQVNLGIPSNSSNVSGIITFIRNQADNVSTMANEKLESCNFPATSIKSVNFSIATKSIYDQPLGPDVCEYEDQWRHLFPALSCSRHYTPTGIEDNQFVLATNLSGAPKQFHADLVSGVQTANLNTDMQLELQFTAPTASELQCDHYVMSDVVYTFRNGRLDKQE